jgi:hypothetical protein
MGKKRRRATKKTCSCGAVVSIFASSCSKCGNAFKSASTLEKRSRGAKKRAAVAASVADEWTAAAVAATKRPPQFLPDSSKSPVASTKLGLLDVLRLVPNVHPGTKEGLPEYVSTRIISCLTCPGTDAERVCEPPYVDYHEGLVARCQRERRPLPPLPRPKYVIRKARGGLHSDVQALSVACAHGFDTLFGMRGIEVGGHFTRVQRPTSVIRYATPAYIVELSSNDPRRKVLEPWPTPAVDSETTGLLLQPRLKSAWSPTSARVTCGPPRLFFNIRALPLLRLPASPYSTLAGERPMFDYVSNKDERRTNSYLLTMEAPLDEAAFLRRLSRLDQAWLAKVRGLPESRRRIVFDALRLAPVNALTAGGCACWIGKKAAQLALLKKYGCSADDLRKAEKESIKLSGDFESSTGDTLRPSEALKHYVLHSKALGLTDVFLEDGCSLASLTYADRLKCDRVYDVAHNCYDVTAPLQKDYVVVVPVPGRKIGIAAPGYGPERELTERLGQAYDDLRGCSPWPGQGIFQRLIELMSNAYEPSETALAVVGRHCGSGLAGSRLLVMTDGVKVAAAIVSGARHLYPDGSVDLSWRWDWPLLNRCAPTKDKSKFGGAPAYGFVRSADDERGLAQRASRVRDATCRGRVNEHLMVYSFLFERLGSEIPEGLPRAPPGLLTEEHFGVGHSYCTLIRHFGERLSGADEKQARDELFEEDTAWWNEIGV